MFYLLFGATIFALLTLLIAAASLNFLYIYALTRTKPEPNMKYAQAYLTVFFLLFMLLFSSFVSAQPNKTYTLLVGLSAIDDSNYVRKYGRAYGKESIAGVTWDLLKMMRLAERNRHEVVMLENKKATRKGILDEMGRIGKKVRKGDAFIFYYSGHGDLVMDANGDEKTGFDQVMVAYDDFLIDDEVYTQLKTYFRETNNVMIVDACHSSTTYKAGSFFLDFVRSRKKGSTFSNENLSEKQFTLLADCKLDSPVVIEEPFNLVYFGATGDADLAAGDPINGGLLTYWLDAIIGRATHIGTWKQYNYHRLACELNARMMSYGQYLQFHEIGLGVSSYSLNIPFKFE